MSTIRPPVLITTCHQLQQKTNPPVFNVLFSVHHETELLRAFTETLENHGDTLWRCSECG